MFKSKLVSKLVASKHPLILIIKPIIALFAIYLVSAIVAELIIISLFLIIGMDLRAGFFPDNTFTRVVPLYGFIFFILGTVVYCKCIGKVSLASIGIIKKNIIGKYFLGFIVGVILVTSVLLITVASHAIVFEGVNQDVAVSTVLVFLGGFMIQGLAEEVLVRGYLLMTLMKRTTTFIAILISSLIFTLFHMPTLLVSGLQANTIGVINLMLFSILISIIMIKTRNIFIVGAIHSAWNFFLGIVYGIHVSGGERYESILNFAIVDGKNRIHGGSYGLESGIITTVIMTVAIVLYYFLLNLKGQKKVAQSY